MLLSQNRGMQNHRFSKLTKNNNIPRYSHAVEILIISHLLLHSTYKSPTQLKILPVSALPYVNVSTTAKTLILANWYVLHKFFFHFVRLFTKFSQLLRDLCIWRQLLIQRSTHDMEKLSCVTYSEVTLYLCLFL